MVTALVCCWDTRRRNKIVTLLQQMGCTVVGEAADPPHALRFAHATNPEIILIDIDPFDHNSLEMCQILAREKIAPLLLITAPYQENMLDMINEEYVMSYVVKPITRWSLESGLHTALSSFRKMTQKESEITKLKDTLETRKLVERAKHLLMKSLKIDEAEAFRRLQKQSMDKGIPMKNLAEAIILNAEMNA